MCQSLEKVMLQKLTGMPQDESVIGTASVTAKPKQPKAKPVSAPATSTLPPVSNHIDTPPIDESSERLHSPAIMPPAQPIKVRLFILELYNIFFGLFVIHANFLKSNAIFCLLISIIINNYITQTPTRVLNTTHQQTAKPRAG